MKKLLGGVMTLGVAAMLSAAPQTPQSGTTDTSQQTQTGGKHGKRKGKKHRDGNQSCHNGKGQQQQPATTNPGN